MIEEIKKSANSGFSHAKTFLKDLFQMDNIALIMSAGLALVWSFGSIGVLNQNYALQQQVDQASLDNQIISLQNKNLKLQQAYYKTDEFLGLQARALLGKANPGENLVLLPQSTSLTVRSSTAPSGQPQAKITDKSNLSQWTDFLFGSR